MKFCVLVKISRRSVSFWYQSDRNSYAPLCMRESNEVPLYFYVSGNDFMFGSTAREFFNRNAPDAYGNYFELIRNPAAHFSIYGHKKPVKQLIYHGIEQYLSHFLNTVLYKTDSIESYRKDFPLRFLFDNDIEEHEQSLIEYLFQEAGYFNLDRVDFNKALFEVLTRGGVLPAGKGVLLLSGIDDVLYLNLYQKATGSPVGTFKLQDQGADPRVKLLAGMIVDYIIVNNSYLSIDKDREIAGILPFCAALLGQGTAMIKGEVMLSDGNNYWFKVNERNLNESLQYYSNDGMIYTAIDDLLKSGSMQVQDVVILLGTEEISTNYFSEKLLKRYHHVSTIRTADTRVAMNAVFAGIAGAGYVVAAKVPAATPAVVVAAPAMPQANTDTVVKAPPLPKIPVKPPLPPKPVPPALPPLPRMPDAKPASATQNNPVKLPPVPPKKS